MLIVPLEGKIIPNFLLLHPVLQLIAWNQLIGQFDEWLKQQTWNLPLYEGIGSNPTGVVFSPPWVWISFLSKGLMHW